MITRLDPHGYVNNSQFQFSVAQECVETLDLERTASLLDIGCGDGRVTHQIAYQVPHGVIVGVDASPEMIDYAQANHKHPNLEFHLADVIDLPWENHFDYAVSFNCLQWVDNKKEAFLQIQNALKPGGKACLALFSSDSPFSDAFYDVFNQKPFKDYKRRHTYFGQKEAKQILPDYPFTVKEYSIVFSDQEALKNYTRGWLPLWIDFPQVVQEAFLESAAQYCQEHFYNPVRGTIEVVAKILFFRFEKVEELRE